MKNISIGKKITVIQDAALAKKAKDIALLDLRKLPVISDYFILASGDSITHIEAIADNIEKELFLNGQMVRHREGLGDSRWILLDCGDVIAHVFHSEARSFYGLDKLWHDSARKMSANKRFKKKAKTPMRRKRGLKTRKS